MLLRSKGKEIKGKESFKMEGIINRGVIKIKM